MFKRLKKIEFYLAFSELFILELILPNEIRRLVSRIQDIHLKIEKQSAAGKGFYV